jgi:hypothetical protein
MTKYPTIFIGNALNVLNSILSIILNKFAMILMKINENYSLRYVFGLNNVAHEVGRYFIKRKSFLAGKRHPLIPDCVNHF